MECNCDICTGNVDFLDDEYCGYCDNTLEDCVCETCEYCDELMEYCDCEICESCWKRVDDDCECKAELEEE